MTVNNHRTVAGTKAARRGMAETGRILPGSYQQSPEIDQWNQAAEAKKARKQKC